VKVSSDRYWTGPVGEACAAAIVKVILRAVSLISAVAVKVARGGEGLGIVRPWPSIAPGDFRSLFAVTGTPEGEALGYSRTWSSLSTSPAIARLWTVSSKGLFAYCFHYYGSKVLSCPSLVF